MIFRRKLPDKKNIEPRLNKQQGFTIIELMIATTVFSLVLMISLAGVMQITKMYYQGVTLVRTQEVSRNLIDEIGESIRFSKDAIVIPVAVPGPGPPATNGVKHLCIGAKRYTYAIDRQLSLDPDANREQMRHVLWVDQPVAGCSVAANLEDEDPSGGLGGNELISENMRLTNFEIIELSSVDELYEVNVTIVYGDTDLIEYSDNPVTCKSNTGATEFCAVSNISVTIGRRL